MNAFFKSIALLISLLPGCVEQQPGRYCHNGSVKLWTEHFGDKSNPAILLIHGAASHMHFWPKSFCKHLADNGYFVIRYDQRDSGFSERFPKAETIHHPPYTAAEMASDVPAILDCYGIDRAHIVGHSMGGFIVEQNLINDPERISTATIIGSGPTVDPSAYKELNLSQRDHKALKILFSAKPSGLYYNDRKNWKDKWTALNGDYQVDDNLMDEYTTRFYLLTRKTPNTKNHISMFTTMSPTLAYDLKEVTVPTLILHGTKDILVPLDHGQAISKLIPNSKLVPLEGAGHMFFDQRLWNQIAQEILNFIK